MHENIKKKKGRWESFTKLDGLGHACRSLMEDGYGNIWLATNNGLSRYDSKRFVNFSAKDGLAGNEITCLHQDRDGNIWIGTRENGLSRYDGNRFVNFSAKDGLAGNEITCLHQDRDGNIWIGTRENGLSRYDGNRFVNFTAKDGLAGNEIICLYQDRDGSIWIGTQKSGVSRYDGNRFVNLTAKDGLPSNIVNCVHQDRDGNIWIGTRNGLSRYDGSGFINFSDDDGLPSNRVLCVCPDKDGNIWLGTNGMGASCYDGSEFVNFNTQDGLAGNVIYDIIEDRERNLWFACGDGGLARYNPYEISYISDEMVNEAMIQGEYGNLWWESGNILSRFDGKDVSHYPFESRILELFEDSKGQLWVGTHDKGVFRYDNIKDIEGQKPRNFTTDDGLANNEVWRIREDVKGNIWIGTWGGVSCYDGVKFINFTTADGLGSDIVSAIYQDRSGRLWFGSFDEVGISSYDGKSFYRYTTNNGLVDDRVICVMEDDKGNLWIGTPVGISCYNGKSFKNYTADDGLLGGYSKRLLQDSKGHIWIATSGGGVSRFDGENFQVLTMADGLPCNNATGIIEDSDGSLIISCFKGICRYMPDYKMAPLVQIDEIDADKIYKEPKDIQISESVKSIRIKYHGLSFKTKRMRYNYILEGYDKEWQATWDEGVRYENLPLGEYTFKVIAINRDLVYSEQPAELKLKIIADPKDQVIRELEAHLNSIVQSIEDVIWSVSVDSFELLYLSPAAEKAYGRPLKEFIENPNLWRETIHPEDLKRLENIDFQKLLKTGTLDIEFRIIRPDGEVRWIRSRGWIVQDANGLAIKLEGISSDITERKQAEETIRNLAYQDFLTNLPNRRLFIDRINLELTHAKRHKQLIAIMFLDLDKFKMINDTLGHAAGDQFLKNVAKQLTKLFRESDTIARFGGDEFAMILPEVSKIEDAAMVAQRIIENFKPPTLIGNHEFPITASVGIAIYPKDGEDAETLLRNADIAMYCAKTNGRNRYQFYPPPRLTSRGRGGTEKIFLLAKTHLDLLK